MKSKFNLGLCYIDLGETQKALDFFEDSELLSNNNEIRANQIGSWFCLALINSCLKLTEQAYIFAEKTFRELENAPFDSWSKGYSLLFLGQTYKNLGEIKKSFEMYKRAIEYAKKSHYTQVKAKALYGLAELYREQGDFTTALSHHTESIELLEKIGAKCDLAEAYYQLALTYQKMGDTKSQPNFQKAIELFTEMEAPKQVEKVQRAMENGENN